jgi:hypothetical protein
LTFAVAGGYFDELGGQRGKIVCRSERVHLGLEVDPFVRQFQPSESVDSLDGLFDGGQPLLDRRRRPFPSSLGLVCFEGVEVPPHSPAFDAALSERGLVLFAHGPRRGNGLLCCIIELSHEPWRSRRQDGERSPRRDIAVPAGRPPATTNVFGPPTMIHVGGVRRMETGLHADVG